MKGVISGYLNGKEKSKGVFLRIKPRFEEKKLMELQVIQRIDTKQTIFMFSSSFSLKGNNNTLSYLKISIKWKEKQI